MIDKVQYFSTLKNIFGKITYFDLNSTNIFWTVFIVIIYISLIMYFYININITSIRQNWDSNRCNPLYMPFAGYIANPKDMSKLEYNELNSTICLKKLYQKIVDGALTSIKWSETIVTDALQASKSILNAIFNVLQKLRNSLSKILDMIFEILNNVLIAVEQLLNLILDIINRILAVITVGYYFGIEVFETTGSLTHKLWNFTCIVFITVITVFLVPLIVQLSVFLAPSTITIISGWISYYIGVALKLGGPWFQIPAAVIQSIGNVLKTTGKSTSAISIRIGKSLMFTILSISTIAGGLLSWMGPAIGGVFANNPMVWPWWYLATLASFNAAVVTNKIVSMCFEKNTLIKTNNGVIKIKHIKPGTILEDGSKVTAVLKLDGSTSIFYKLDDIIVSGTHTVNYKNKWIHVENHPEAIKIGTLNESIYCLNTTNKKIKINNTLFCDYDTVTAIELEYLKLKFPNITYNTFNKYIGKGLANHTQIKLLNNNKVTIDKIKIGDTLQNNIRVCATVVLKDEKNNILYNLITDKGYFYINNKKYLDLNHELEQYLQDIPNRYI